MRVAFAWAIPPSPFSTSDWCAETRLQREFAALFGLELLDDPRARSDPKGGNANAIQRRVACALAATVSWGASATAAPPDADRLKAAAEEFDSGRRAFKIKDFENSAVYSRALIATLRAPKLCSSAIRARKEAGHTARAATLAALALKSLPRGQAVGEGARQILAESETL